jgi:type IV pilus assembly protein PilV
MLLALEPNRVSLSIVEAQMPAPKNSQSGFTLIEMLVSIVILAVGLLGLAQLQVTAIKTNSQSMTSTTAQILAQKVIEEVVAKPADDALFNGASTGTWPGSPYTEDGGGTYNVTYDVAQLTAGGYAISNLFKVTITVQSASDVMFVSGQKSHSVSATTLKRAI